MKTSTKFFAMLLSALAFAGCSSCPCEKNSEKAPVAVAKTVAAPAVAPVVQKSAPVTSSKSETASIPAATRRYVSK